MTLLLTIISIETFSKAVCLHLGLYCEVDVTMVANEVNNSDKFSLFIDVEITRI
jgi:hypothetical protein